MTCFFHAQRTFGRRCAFLTFMLLLVSASARTNDSALDKSTARARDNKFTIVPDRKSGFWNRLQDDAGIDYGESGIYFFPTLVIGEVPVYNLPGVQNRLNFSPDALAGIFLGQIVYWDDRVLKRANPTASLPHRKILVVHREDETGETVLWTDYLSKVNAQWRVRVGSGTDISWPVGKGVTEDDGLVDAVRENRFSIGYLERSLAMKSGLRLGRVQNLAGRFLDPEAAGLQSAATERIASLDFSSSLSITNASGTNSYPIAGFSGLLIPGQMPDVAKKKAMIDFLRWVLTAGQRSAAKNGYVPLPKQIVRKELETIDTISK
jgi:phosphate transport system substrate-binding protein